MTDENADTADLTINEKLDRILAEMADMHDRLGAVETRLGAIESLVEDRLKDTRQDLAGNQSADRAD
jgi:hypothetical protein